MFVPVLDIYLAAHYWPIHSYKPSPTDGKRKAGMGAFHGF